MWIRSSQPAIAGKYSYIPEPSPPDAVQTSRAPFVDSNLVCVDEVLIYYQNAGGMNCDVEQYLLATSDDCYDVIVLAETWLDSRTLSSQVFGPEYEVFRCDRGPMNSRKSTGGGVLIAVNKKRKARVIYNDLWGCVEQVWVRLQLSHRSVFLCALYIPPDRVRDDTLIEAHTQSVLSVIEMTNASDEIIIIGDFNLPGISWSSSCNGFLHIDMERSSLHSHASKLLDYYSTATLRQINHVTNENNRSLDLCFVSAQDAAPLILHAPSPLVKVVNHHPSLILKLNNTRANVVASIEPIIYNFHNADHHSIAEFFATLDWVDILGGCDAENAALTLSHIIGHVIERHVPKKIVAPYSCPWQTRQLRRMKTAKRAALKRYSKHGPDGIPSAFLKRHIELLLAPFQLIFNKSLSSGLFPSVWKTATMFPVYKKGDRKDVNNYRGISSLCAASKLFELVITEPLISHCKQHLSADQHGFISGRSTTTNLLCLTSSITDSFVQKAQTDVVYTDLSAAFDKINHAITVAKLERFGIAGYLLRWFHSYLTGRRLSVTVGNSQSTEFLATSGIPQEAILAL
ncbi:uncharacterized protein LOC134209350 [Armigeres subalbatus]|uniref:uncharacterized protein LOC134209350 n=1 Tax=Armigeres subalbatus TaxID=124917 RepID=UPI002ED554CC